MNLFDLTSHLMLETMNPLISSNSNKIRRENMFFADGNIESVTDYLKLLLENLKCSPIIDGCIIECFKTFNNELINFNLELFDIKGDICLVEVRREKGDILDFNKLFGEIYEKCEISFKEKL
jgi:hypothetical protein